MSSSVHNGYAFVKIGDQEETVAPNEDVVTDNLREALYRDVVAGKRPPVRTCYPNAQPNFLRYGNYRCKKEGMMVHGHCSYGQSNNWRKWSYYHRGNPREDMNHRMKYHDNIFIDTGLDGGSEGYPMAVGSVCAFWHWDQDALGGGSPTRLPDNWAPAAVSWADMPLTTIGPVFKHEAGQNRYFHVPGDEGGDNPLSQGDVEIGGAYNPPENLLAHRAYRVYISKSGGVGEIDSGIGEQVNGQLTAGGGGDDIFTDAASGGHFLAGTHDTGNHYIAIRSGDHVGTFLIKGVTDTNNVTIDSKDINEGVANDGPGLSWTLRSGPVGEYFFQNRGYCWNDRPSLTPDITINTLRLNDALVDIPDTIPYTMKPSSTVFDKGAHWWFLSNSSETDVIHKYGLMRWMYASPLGFDPIYADGEITDMPVGIGFWRDLKLDDDNKLWVSWDLTQGQTPDAPDASVCLAKVDPYPGGSSRYPACTDKYSAQTSADDASGLCSSDPRGIVCATYQDSLSTRIWVLHGPGGGGDQDNGGISYTDDYGTTWKRLHRLHSVSGAGANTVDVSGTAVTGTGTAFTTDFAVGDWVRFDTDTRSYEITNIADDLNMTIASAHPSGHTGVAYQKGALEDDNARMAVCDQMGSWDAKPETPEASAPPPCDYHPDGRLFCIGEGYNRVCYWDESQGKVTAFLDTELPTPGGNFNANYLKSLVIMKLAQCADDTYPEGHGFMFLGSGRNGTWIFRNDFNPVNSTRACPYVADDNFPSYWDMTQSSDNAWHNRLVYNRHTNWAGIISSWHNSTPKVYRVHTDSFGQAGSWPAGMREGSSNISFVAGNDIGASYLAMPNANYCDTELGSFFSPVMRNTEAINSSGFWYHGVAWNTKAWKGADWEEVFFNGLLTDLDFRGEETVPGAGPFIPTGTTWTCGVGTRRMHEDWRPLQYGMTVRFAEESGVSQQNQYIWDENVTWVSYVGTGKNNVQDVTWGHSYHVTPTVWREYEEDPREIKNMWTSDGGIDGGYYKSDSSYTENSTLYHTRGVAEFSPSASKGVMPYMPNFLDEHSGGWAGYNDHDNPRLQHFYASLRIADELELSDGDCSTPTTFGSAGHTFDSGDVGKTIVIEGSSAVDGHYIIESINGPNSVEVDQTFGANESSVRWKLRDIPIVSYVLVVWEWYDQYHTTNTHDYKLYTSRDSGETWTKVMEALNHFGISPNDPLPSRDNVYVNNKHTQKGECGRYDRAAMIFDLTNLTENERRRQYWKFLRWNDVGSGDTLQRFASVQLRDANFNMIGVPAECKCTDADDPLFYGDYLHSASIVPFEGNTDLLTAVEDDDGGDWTDTLQTSGSFYLANGTADAEVTAAGHVIVPPAATGTGDTISGTAPDMTLTDSGASFQAGDVGKTIILSGATTGANDGEYLITAVNGATSIDYYNPDGSAEAFTTGTWQLGVFTAKDLGRKMRIPGAVGAPPNDPEYTGWSSIVSIVNGLEVETDQAFVADTNLDWALLAFGVNDRIIFDEDGTWIEWRQRFLRAAFADITYIADVPSSNTVVLRDAIVPLQAPLTTTGVHFYIISEFPDGVKVGPNSGYFEEGDVSLAAPGRFGAYYFSDDLEFLTLQAEQASDATSPADTDGDGRVQTVSVGVMPSGLNTVQVGDYILLDQGTGRRRVHEITDISGTGPWTITVKYDEIRPSQTFSHTLYRRRGLKWVPGQNLIIADDYGIS